MFNSLLFVDYFMLGVIGVSVLIGLWRGFLREVLSLAAWIVAFGVAVFFLEEGVALLAGHVTVIPVRVILSFGGLFLITLLVAGIVNIVLGQIVLRSGLTGIDRGIGGGFGCLRGIAMIAVLVLLAGFTPLPHDPWWEHSKLLPYFEQMALGLRGLLPADYGELLKFSPPGAGFGNDFVSGVFPESDHSFSQPR